MREGRNGGYDDGYAVCDLFWGRQPGSLVRDLYSNQECEGLRVLDLGCGEGKNAAFLAERGAFVDAVDCSSLALANARCLWGANVQDRITWHLDDAFRFVSQVSYGAYDIVIMYGLLHCLSSINQIHRLVERCDEVTADSGRHLVCTFNDRSHDLSGHPEFSPLLLPHATFEAMYSANQWLVVATDSDLFEIHPHNDIPHHHSMTRIVATRSA